VGLLRDGMIGSGNQNQEMLEKDLKLAGKKILHVHDETGVSITNQLE
jgi:hypothetical protein